MFNARDAVISVYGWIKRHAADDRGQALAKSLYGEGVHVIFGLPGVQLYHLLDGLYDATDIRFIATHHRERLQGRLYGSELHHPGFMKLAETYSARGTHTLNAKELETTCKAALTVSTPTLLEAVQSHDVS